LYETKSFQNIFWLKADRGYRITESSNFNCFDNHGARAHIRDEMVKMTEKIISVPAGRKRKVEATLDSPVETIHRQWSWNSATIKGRRFQTCEDVRLERILGDVVRYSIETNNREVAPSAFDAPHPPPITIQRYLARFGQHEFCSDECYILAWIYIRRALNLNESFSLTDGNVHRLLLAAIIVATKFHDDEHYANFNYARIGGVDANELMKLETHMLALLHWNAHVSEQDFAKASLEYLPMTASS